MNMNAKIFNKILESQIQQDIKKIIHHNQMKFTYVRERWFNIWNPSINVIHHINKMKRKLLQDHLNRCQKSIQQNSTPFHDKNMQTRNRRKLPQHNKGYI